MKYRVLYCILACAALIACQSEEPNEPARTLAFDVYTVSGTTPAGMHRINTNGTTMTTTFSVGDKSGVFAIKDGQILDNIAWRKQATVGVVLASKGYPGAYTKGAEITGTENFDGLVLHMGTAVKDGKLETNGGRVLMCIADGDDVRQAQQKAYTEIKKIHCSNLFYRKDIAHWAL